MSSFRFLFFEQAYYQCKNGDTQLQQDLDDKQQEGGRAMRREVLAAWALDPTKGQCYAKMRMGFGQKQTWTQKEYWQGKNAFVPGSFFLFFKIMSFISFSFLSVFLLSCCCFPGLCGRKRSSRPCSTAAR